MMKRRCLQKHNGRHWMNITVVFILCLGVCPVLAQAESDISLTLGVGGNVSPLYSGSDEVGFSPLPVIDARYSIPHLELFLSSFDGAGLTLSDERLGISFSLGVNGGEERDTNEDNDDVKALLQGTPDVKNPCRVFGSIEIVLPVGELFATTNYFPIETDYDGAAKNDETYHGVLIEAGWGMEMPLTDQMLLETNIGTSWMDGEYAEAYHSVRYQTPKLKEFDAKSGIRDVNASLTLLYLLTDHLGTGVFGSATQLLGDAAESPLTKQEFQGEAGFAVFYRF